MTERFRPLRNLLSHGPDKIDPSGVHARDVPIPEFGLTLLYLVIAAVWFVFADDALDWITGSPVATPAIQTLQGINFVITSALVLYLILRQAFRGQRLAMEALRVSQERFEAVALATTGAIWDLNLATKVIWWSDGIQKMFGYRAADVSSNFEWWLDRLHPEDRERVLELLRRVADGAEKTWAGEYRFRKQDGTYAIVMDRGWIIHDPAGNPIRVVGGITDVSEQRAAEDALENSRQQLRALAGRLQRGREEERANVAREIHDELGQALTALKINLDWLERRIEDRENDSSLNPLLDRVVESGAMIESALGSVQRIATDLRPALLDDLGLPAALEEEGRRFQQRTGIACVVKVAADLPTFPRDSATAVFRVFQEALTNVARHSQAKSVYVSFAIEAGYAVLQISDNGVGIPPGAIGDPRSLGLLGMKERAAAAGGDLAVKPIPPNGTRITLRVPQPTAETTHL